ncbi:MAG: hypothetical protein II401_06055 [Bacteroidales bacterium]|nr:hypothetical protein [Bacteroidales bacterium]
MYHRELVDKLLEAFLGQRDKHLTGVFRASSGELSPSRITTLAGFTLQGLSVKALMI